MMTVVVFGIDALDPDLVNSQHHPNLVLEAHKTIETIDSSTGEPSTHELWPSIITGLPPNEHGIQLEDGVAWENPLLKMGSLIAESVLPSSVQTKLGAWLLTNTDADAFRMPATYYEKHDISTIFDSYKSKAIGIPNYVVDHNSSDREHQLRQQMGDLFERDSEAEGGHTSSDPEQFYELCMEMSMIRGARIRRALRERQYELVFGYTSGLDLIGHVSVNRPDIQERAYEELNDFVGELAADLGDDDELVLVSDHGLQDGLHTHEAMIASSTSNILDNISILTDIRRAIEQELQENDHRPSSPWKPDTKKGSKDSQQVVDQLEDLGYM